MPENNKVVTVTRSLTTAEYMMNKDNALRQLVKKLPAKPLNQCDVNMLLCAGMVVAKATKLTRDEFNKVERHKDSPKYFACLEAAMKWDREQKGKTNAAGELVYWYDIELIRDIIQVTNWPYII